MLRIVAFLFALLPALTLAQGSPFSPPPTVVQVNGSVTTGDCKVPILTLGPSSYNTDITCYNATGTLNFERNAGGQNVITFQNTNVGGVSAIAFMGFDPYYPLSITTGSISGTTMTVASVMSGIRITPGMYVYGTGVSGGTFVVAQISGKTGGAGTYTVSPAQTVSSTTLTAQLVREHFATGWGNNPQPVGFVEVSTFDGQSDPLEPPPEFFLWQTGGVDPTGGTFVTCNFTAGSTSFSGCSGNIGANGNLMFGGVYGISYGQTQTPATSGIQARTTLVSGGGTTSGVMSAPATASGTAVGVVFSNPSYAQRPVMHATRTGQLAFANWDNSTALNIDRILDRISIGGSVGVPQAMLHVGGTGRFDGNLGHFGTYSDNCYDYHAPSSGDTYQLPTGKCGALLVPAGALATLALKLPASAGDGQIAWFLTTKPIASLTVQPGAGATILSGTVPATLAAGGSFQMIYSFNDGAWHTMAAGTGSVSASPPYTAVISSSQTVTLPSGWTALRYRMVGAAGGSGCGIVVPSGTAASAGGTGGTGATVTGELLASQVNGATSLVVTVGTAGTSCTASGTTANSTGSTPTAGTATSFTLGGLSFSGANGGGAGSNGQPNAASAGGSSGSAVAQGSNASGSSPGTTGNGGVNGSAGAATCSTGVFIAGCGGAGSPNGTQPSLGQSNVFPEMPTPGAPGPGLATTPVALAGIHPLTTYLLGPGDGRGTPGAASCSTGAQNATAATYGGIGLHGQGGSSGASCTAANGGNGGAAAGYGASGGAGAPTLVGFTAGNGGPSTGGAVMIVVY